MVFRLVLADLVAFSASRWSKGPSFWTFFGGSKSGVEVPDSGDVVVELASCLLRAAFARVFFPSFEAFLTGFELSFFDFARVFASCFILRFSSALAAQPRSGRVILELCTELLEITRKG